MADRGRPAVTELEEKVAAVTKLDEQLNAKKEAEGLSTLRRRLSELDPPPAADHRHIWTLVGGQTEPTCIRCGVTRREHDGGAEPWSEVPLDTNHIALRYRSGPAEASANDVPALLKALSATRAELSRLTEARDRLQSRVDDLEGRIGCNWPE